MTTLRRLRDPWLHIGWISVSILFFLVLLPQLWLVKSSLTEPSGAHLTLDNLVTVLTQEYPYKTAIGNSYFVGILGTLGPLLLGVPLAYVVSRYQIPQRSTLITLVSISMVLPAFVGAYAWILLLGRFGLVNNLLGRIGVEIPSMFGWKAVAWAQSWAHYPLVFLMCLDAFSSINPDLEEAAMNMGANTRKTASSISLRMAAPAILNATYLVFILAFTDFGTPMFLGGGFLVLPTLAYSEFLSETGGNMPMASAVSVIMIVVCSTALFLSRLAITRQTYENVSTRTVELKKLPPLGKALVGLWAWGIVAVALLPWATAIVSSFIQFNYGMPTSSLTLDNYRNVFTSEIGKSALVNSLRLTFVSICGVMAFGLLSAYVLVKRNFPVINRMLDTLIMLPWVIPGTVMGIGFILTFNRPPVRLTGTWLILVLAFIVRKLPYTVKSIESALYSIHPAYEEAALNLGNRPMRTFFTITTRMLAPAMLSGGTLSFLAIINEFSSSTILYSAKWVTTPIAIFYYSTAQFWGTGAALSVVLMLLFQLAPLFLANKLLKGGLKISV